MRSYYYLFNGKCLAMERHAITENARMSNRRPSSTMAIANTFAFAGIEAVPVQVEVDASQTQAFADGLSQLLRMSRAKKTAIMCAEAVPWRCHRSLVADALLVRGIAVSEILSETNRRDHKLTPFAHVEGTRITYPPAQTNLI